jgi:hypothetical protein
MAGADSVSLSFSLNNQFSRRSRRNLVGAFGPGQVSPFLNLTDIRQSFSSGIFCPTFHDR